jgi:hypothetical protein
MYGLVVQNGYVKALLQLRNHGPHLLPGSNHPILTRFIGIPPLDKLLTLAGVMFANVTDGSHPQLSLYGSYFGGQLIGIFTIMVLEGLRQGNKQTSIAQYHTLHRQLPHPKTTTNYLPLQERPLGLRHASHRLRFHHARLRHRPPPHIAYRGPTLPGTA